MAIEIIKKWWRQTLCALISLMSYAVPYFDQQKSALLLTFVIASTGLVISATTVLSSNLRNDRPFSRFLIISLVTLIAYLSLQVFFGSPQHGPIRNTDPSRSYIELIKISGVFCAFLIGYFTASDSSANRRLIDLLVYSAAFWALCAIIMHVADPNGIYGISNTLAQGRLTGAFSSPNSAGVFFGSSTILALGRLISRFVNSRTPDFVARIDPALSVSMGLCLSALALTMSRGAIFATIISAICLCSALTWRFKTARYIVPILLTISLPVAFFTLSTGITRRAAQVGNDFTVRQQIYADHFQTFMTNPWFGFGLGSFSGLNNHILNGQNYHSLSIIRAAHNVYLQWLEECGIFGLVLIVLLNVSILMPIALRSSSRRSADRQWTILAAYSVFLIHGFTDYGFQEPVLAVYCAMILGSGYALSRIAASPRDIPAQVAAGSVAYNSRF